MQTLRSRIFTAVAWGFGSQVVVQLLRLILNIYLTHLLSPELFGVAAIAGVVMIGIAMVSDLGLGPNIIRSSRGRDADFLNTAWTLQVLRGGVTWLIALSIAGLAIILRDQDLVPASSVYASAQLPGVIAALATTALIAGFTSTKVHEARRSLTVGRLTVNEVLAQVVGMGVVLSWLWFDQSVWALVVGSIGNSIASMILSHVNLPGQPNRLRWERSAVSELARFGAWIFLSSMVSFASSNCDRLLLGALLSSALLGVYSVAYGLFSTVEQLAARMIVTIALPALSETLRDRPTQLSSVYYRFYKAAAAIMYGLSGILFVAAPEIVHLFYDPRYTDAGWMLQFLAFGFLSVPSQIAVQVFIAKGEPHLAALILFFRMLVLFPAVLGGFYCFGVQGAVAGLAVSFLSMVPITFCISARRGLLRVREELILVPAFFVGLAFGKIGVFATAWLRYWFV